MAVVEVVVPAEHRARVREELLAVYGGAAESLYYAVGQHISLEPKPISEVLKYRAKLAELDGLIEQFGWQRQPAKPCVLRGTDALVWECMWLAFYERVEELAEGVPNPLSPPPDLDAIQGALKDLSTLAELVAQAQPRQPVASKRTRRRDRVRSDV